jgi:glycerate 2-kinase
VVDLESIYVTTLRECAPDRLVSRCLRPGMPRNVAAIGKCAGKLIDGVPFDRAFCAIPRGYPRPDASQASRLGVAWGGHPDIDDDSFNAGEQLLAFVDSCDDVLFLVSGGGSACVEVPLPPFTREEVSMVSARLVTAGLPIGEINTVRKHLSAIKGGRLAARVRGRSMTLVYSDVSTGAIGDVASGPTVADSSSNEDAIRILDRIGGCESIVTKLRRASETIKQIANATAEVIADNTTLTATAAHLVTHSVLLPDQIEMNVEDAAIMLAGRAATLRSGEVLVAGGEPTVARRGTGKGGRCCELAVRFAMRARNPALFGSSDGVDGSSGVAAVVVNGAAGREPPVPTLLKLLENSDSLAAAELVGRTIIIPPAGNNLRDLFLVSADNGTMAHH